MGLATVDAVVLGSKQKTASPDLGKESVCIHIHGCLSSGSNWMCIKDSRCCVPALFPQNRTGGLLEERRVDHPLLLECHINEQGRGHFNPREICSTQDENKRCLMIMLGLACCMPREHLVVVSGRAIQAFSVFRPKVAGSCTDPAERADQ